MQRPRQRIVRPQCARNPHNGQSPRAGHFEEGHPLIFALGPSGPANTLVRKLPIFSDCGNDGRAGARGGRGLRDGACFITPLAAKGGRNKRAALMVSVKELPAFLDWARTAQTDRERGIFLQMARTWLEIAVRWSALQTKALHDAEPSGTTKGGIVIRFAINSR
jgi:hypothetical protein